MSSTFELLPAIDLRGGRVVRLVQGDFARELVYGSDPAEIARSFADAGAEWLHVVDLDGARAGGPRQSAVVAAIVAAVEGRARCELAGGLRTPEAVRAALDAGADRVAVGTAVLGDASLARRLVAMAGAEGVVAALDVRDGLAVGEGWRQGAPGVPVETVLARLADAGIERFEVTAIERDGGLGGPDLGLLRRLVDLGRGAIVASGGIRSVDDLLAARSVGASGAIVGRAIYEGRLDLGEAVRALREDVR